LALVLIALAVVVLVVACAGLAVRSRRIARLREPLGQRVAGGELRSRPEQRLKPTIAPLPERTRTRYAGQWRELQAWFIDEPSRAVIAADALVRQVMGDEGYPIDDFGAQADLVAVDHPRVVNHYRIAHDVCERTRAREATTEDMRVALRSYRSLFDELLAPGGHGLSGEGRR
jgi:hypothetical protein